MLIGLLDVWGFSRSELIRAPLVRVLKRPPSRGELALASFYSSLFIGNGDACSPGS